MFISIILLILLGIDWASGYVIASYTINHGVNPYGYAFWQSFGPMLILIIIQTFRKDLWLDRYGVKYTLLCGLFGIVIPNLMIYFAAAHIPSGLLTVLANIAPIITYPLAIMFRDERFDIRRMLWILVGVVGVILIIVPSSGDIKDSFGNAWGYLAIIIPISYAFSAVYISRFRPKTGNELNFSMWMLMVATMCTSPMALIAHGYYPLSIGDTNTYLIIGEILLSGFGYVLLFTLIKRVGAVYYTLVNAVSVLAGVIYGYVIFGQKYSLLTYISISLILLAIMGLTYTQWKNTRKIKC